MATDVAGVLPERSSSDATGSAKAGTGCSAWSLQSGLQGAFTTCRGEVTYSVPSSAQKGKTTISRWMFFLHLPRAKEAGSAVI